MGIVIDKKLSDIQAEMALRVVNSLNLRDYNLEIMVDNDILLFTKGRFVVRVPIDMIKKEAWSDIRFLFKSVLESSPLVFNTGADNTWGPEGPDY